MYQENQSDEIIKIWHLKDQFELKSSFYFHF